MTLLTRAASSAKLRAAIIGHTGHGNYGHDHDLIFKGRENIEVAAVTDPDEAGRAKAVSRSEALRSYADYGEMLAKEKPDLLCIAPRWTDQHHAMAMAGLQAGAHLYVEKPFTQTLAEADEILAEARKRRRKIVVAHQMRLAPNILQLKQSREQGFLGELLAIRAHGKQDSRAGGEDLIVLGVHLFDLMRFFAGDPQWCTARVLQDGHEITLADARPATEKIGPVAGNDITAEFAFPNGLRGGFASRAKYREAAGPWGMELLGSKRSAKILMEMVPRIYVLEPGAWAGQARADQWRPWPEDPTLKWPESARSLAAANARVVDEWLAAIAQDREPECGGEAGMRAFEMAMAVFAAGLARTRVEIPLARRQHPLGA
ncbi:MAG TPA: Gfo/Idh/MocA family oxidoreductase [Verrucomicrobiae bacterium]